LNAQLGQSIRHCQSRDHQFLKRNFLLPIGCGDFASLFRGHYHMDSSHNATEENALQKPRIEMRVISELSYFRCETEHQKKRPERLASREAPVH
jgi:hypothetical protein